MATLHTSDFTNQAETVKSELDKFFRIPIKEDAERIITGMRAINNPTNHSSLGDYDKKLLAILCNDEKYMEEHSRTSANGVEEAVSLFESFNYADLERNESIINQYAEYVKKLKKINELDKAFLRRLNEVYKCYKSSTDYMTRLVRKLLKLHWGYSNEQLKGVSTRVLILRRFLEAFDYDCVEIISTPELKPIVVEKYGGDFEKIEDDIFKLISNDDEIKILAHFKASIIHKSTTIRMTAELCEKLCSVIEGEHLTDAAQKGSAKLLKDCFKEDIRDFDWGYIKTVEEDADSKKLKISPEVLNKLQKINEMFREVYRNQKYAIRKIKKLNEKDDFAPDDWEKHVDEIFENISEIDPFIRAIVCVCEFTDIILSDSQKSDLLKAAFPNVDTSDKENVQNSIGRERLRGKSEERIKAMKDLTELCEKSLRDNLNKKVDFSDITNYLQKIYKKIANRYNEAINLSKKDTIAAKVKDQFSNDTNRYKLLHIADTLANARFDENDKGRMREYLYIFAIAFKMTFGLESVPIAEEMKKADPRNRRFTDIQKNLFHDYYADNIANNFDKKEVYVSGYGINFKNFAEIAFLWCLEQEKLTESEKLKTAYNIIAFCQAKGKTEADFESQKKGRKTNRTLSKIYLNAYKKAYENQE